MDGLSNDVMQGIYDSLNARNIASFRSVDRKRFRNKLLADTLLLPLVIRKGLMALNGQPLLRFGIRTTTDVYVFRGATVDDKTLTDYPVVLLGYDAVETMHAVAKVLKLKPSAVIGIFRTEPMGASTRLYPPDLSEVERYTSWSAYQQSLV